MSLVAEAQVDVNRQSGRLTALWSTLGAVVGLKLDSALAGQGTRSSPDHAVDHDG
jgi:hypothetical protein